eukprot:6967855-Alexandrium_andersonii.AAC.1
MQVNAGIRNVENSGKDSRMVPRRGGRTDAPPSAGQGAEPPLAGRLNVAIAQAEGSASTQPRA